MTHDYGVETVKIITSKRQNKLSVTLFLRSLGCIMERRIKCRYPTTSKTYKVMKNSVIEEYETLIFILYEHLRYIKHFKKLPPI